MKARLAGLQSRRDVEIIGRPTLHTRGNGNKNGPVLRKPDSPSTTDQKDPDQPTLKRQPN